MQEQFSLAERHRLAEARRARGWTLRDLAEATGYAMSTLSQVETGPYIPSPRCYAAILKALDVSEQWLETGTGKMFIPRLQARDAQGNPLPLIPNLYGPSMQLTGLSSTVTSSPMPTDFESLMKRACVFLTARGSKGALADALGVPQTRISDWIQGRQQPRADITIKLYNWVLERERGTKQ